MGITEDKFLTDWEELQAKIVKYAAVSSKTAAKALSVQYSKREATKGNHNVSIAIDFYSSSDRMTTYSLSILSELLRPKGKMKGSIFIQSLVRYSHYVNVNIL